MVTVVFLVALRLTIGWHFFYEGVWKIQNADRFSATPFLSMAKGPAAPLFHAMLPDLDGRQRLGTRTVVTARPLVAAWEKIRANVASQYKLDDLATMGSQVILWDHQEEMETYLRKQNGAIVDFFEAQSRAGRNTAGRERAEQPVPQEVREWIEDLGNIENKYLTALNELAAGGGQADPKVFTPMVPRADERLLLDQIVRAGTIRNPGGNVIISVQTAIPGWEYTFPWKNLKNEVLRKYRPGPEQRFEIQRLYHLYKDSAEEYLAANREFIEAHFASAGRYRDEKSSGNVGAAFQEKRIWDRQQALRGEVDEWLSQLDGMGEEYRSAVWDVLDKDQKSEGMIPAPVSETDRLPVFLLGIRSKTGLLDFAVTYGLTAIGLCLLVGFCTRLAFIGGGVFLVFVLLTQPPWPSIYPPAPEVVGHALIVDKNFVEMMVMFALATTAVGRWAGLDFFIYHWLGKPILARFRQEGAAAK
jgi:uncharacterized membrane protein YphA (DoxX/SURF4 family)